MKQEAIKLGDVYLTRISGKLCKVRVTWQRTGADGQDVFDWVRVRPPASAIKLRGSASAAALHQAPEELPEPGYGRHGMKVTGQSEESP